MQTFFYVILIVIASLIGLVLLFWLTGYLLSFRAYTNALKHAVVKVVMKLVAFLTGVSVEVIGMENMPRYKGKQGYAVIANHQSNFDVVVLAAYLKDPLAFMAKIEIASWPIIGIWAKAIGCTFIDRNNLRQSYGVVMGETRNHIEQGLAMSIFPAGTRSKSNKVLPFKPGSFKVATSIDAPILPVTLVDVYKAPKANMFNRVKVKMIIHPIIEAATYNEMKSFDLAQKVEEIITEPIKDFQ